MGRRPILVPPDDEQEEQVDPEEEQEEDTQTDPQEDEPDGDEDDEGNEPQDQDGDDNDDDEKLAEEEALLEAALQRNGKKMANKAVETPEQVEYLEMDSAELESRIADVVERVLTKALNPIDRKNGLIIKAFNQLQGQVDLLTENQEVIKKSLGVVAEGADKLNKAKQAEAESEAAGKEIEGTTGAQALQKGAVGKPGAGQGVDHATAYDLLQKAVSYQNDNGVAVPGLTIDVTQAINYGTVSQEQLDTLRKGLQSVAPDLV